MPELPETETIARDLNAEIRGARVTSVEVRKADVLRETDTVAFGAALAGCAVVRVWRRAKLVVLDLNPAMVQPGDGSATHTRSPEWHVVVQPRFTGGLLLDTGTLTTADTAYVAVTLHFADGRRLHYRDVRRLGTVALMTATRFARYAGALGLEPLDPTTDDIAFSGLLRASHRPIKVVLMDQRRLAGVGNIYANEALWRAGIDPSREASAITTGESAALRSALCAVLRASIAARGTSFRDYRDARGERGRFVEHLAVYGRAGAPCPRCARRLVGTHAIDGRGTVFCASCQR